MSILGGKLVNAGQLQTVSGTPPLDSTDFGGVAVVSGRYISSPAAWYKFNTGITVTGSGVSAWTDQSGNSRTLLQGTDAARPALQADGSILFDGTDDFLAATFTLSQPATIYLLARQVTWTNSEVFFDGVAGNRMGLLQSATTPKMVLYAGTGSTENANLAVNTYGAIACVFNGASSSLTVNNTTATTGNPGAGNGGGITLGSGNGFGFSNIQVKEMLVYSGAHTAEQIRKNVGYLYSVNSYDGAVYISDLGASAVPATASKVGGIAVSPLGMVYVTTDVPSGAYFRGGVAVRSDGALHVSTSAVAGTDTYIGGIAVSSTGQVRVAIT